ncbi:hypothetical protein FHS29_006963 [Saccharothrix tamanrassetensis]|uniref:DUF3558 domain-containing protein n=1 Tax=Saccharothrix tamanrassetensis TaxID=1051531 RepID=A0A841CSU6_9PSEU|nr:DUF3558 family protein [Saccharothrix tamanrassetensis]MBB5960340.1 hypothetical protein [Saccharothrix tamanrassetensis]
MNSRTSLAVLLTALLAVAACGGPVSGDARPASGASTAGSSTSPSPSGSTSASPSGNAGSPVSLEDTDPCTLVTTDEVTDALGALRKEPTKEVIGTARSCVFAPKPATFAVGIRTNVGLSGVQPNGGVIKDIKVGDRAAKELLGATGSCGIYLGVTDSSRVDVVLNATGQDPCPLALRIAELVEPRLP